MISHDEAQWTPICSNHGIRLSCADHGDGSSFVVGVIAPDLPGHKIFFFDGEDVLCVRQSRIRDTSSVDNFLDMCFARLSERGVIGHTNQLRRTMKLESLSVTWCTVSHAWHLVNSCGCGVVGGGLAPDALLPLSLIGSGVLVASPKPIHTLSLPRSSCHSARLGAMFHLWFHKDTSSQSSPLRSSVERNFLSKTPNPNKRCATLTLATCFQGFPPPLDNDSSAAEGGIEKRETIGVSPIMERCASLMSRLDHEEIEAMKEREACRLSDIVRKLDFFAKLSQPHPNRRLSPSAQQCVPRTQKSQPDGVDPGTPTGHASARRDAGKETSSPRLSSSKALQSGSNKALQDNSLLRHTRQDSSPVSLALSPQAPQQQLSPQHLAAECKSAERRSLALRELFLADDPWQGVCSAFTPEPSMYTHCYRCGHSFEKHAPSHLD